MTRDRRDFLKATGSALLTSAVVSAGATTASAAPSIDWKPAHESNYTASSRNAADVRWIVMHTIEGSYEAGINTFQDPNSDVSAHFVVGEEPGEFTKMVNVDDVAWTAGNYDYNQTAINVELEGSSSNEFSDQLYENAAELVRYLCDGYGIPRRFPGDRIAPCDPDTGEGGIIGHVHVPNPYDCSSRGGLSGHTDPGPHFDWDRFLSLVGGRDGGDGGKDGGDGEKGGGATFEHGQRVATTANLVVHTYADLNAPARWVAPDGSAGYVRDGPIDRDGYTWWKVAYNAGHEGWCVEEYLDEAPLEDEGGKEARFNVDERVSTTADLVIHTGPELSAPETWVAPDGSAGYVRDGPKYADDYTWWNVEFNAGHQGWCVQEYLTRDPNESGDAREVLPFDTRTDLTEPVDVTGKQIDAAIRANRPGSPLIGLGDTFVTVQKKTGVNAVYQAAHAVHESYWGESEIAQDKRNIYGWGAVDSSPYEGAKPFDSFEECVWYVMREVKDLYLTPGNWRYNGPHLDGMNVYYATDDQWAEKIADLYRRLADDL